MSLGGETLAGEVPDPKIRRILFTGKELPGTPPGCVDLRALPQGGRHRGKTQECPQLVGTEGCPAYVLHVLGSSGQGQLQSLWLTVP